MKTWQVIFISFFLLAASSGTEKGLILYAHDGEKCVYASNDQGISKDLFCLDPKSEAKTYGIGYKDGQIFLATNRGTEVTIYQMDMQGKIEKQFVAESLGPSISTFFDMSLDETGFWAVNKTLAHYDLKTIKMDRVFDLPAGYSLANGVAYNHNEDVVYVLVHDYNIRGEKHCPAIAAYKAASGEIIDMIPPEVACNEGLKGLGYDQANKSFWTSNPKQGKFLNLSLEGKIIKELPLGEFYGSIEVTN